MNLLFACFGCKNKNYGSDNSIIPIDNVRSNPNLNSISTNITENNQLEFTETLREKEYLPKLQIKTNITTDDLTDQRINTPEMNLRKI